ncbi:MULTISPECIES: hypothetical protein [unclassified Microbacterium]|uniref:hypothetical protein n=1 Tax=unclassified Microbacterium TaxID=2609290 RepID=UPI00214AAB9F|nr:MULTISPECIES: hypothetical protein [unclassified Microbacterium]MCR2810626.1 hypothetical protein [Microbacterium sp. zg.B185]WIM18163.1 hypothetical protein QNO12_11165 [Microbacterium sp. zg-B185]
MTKSTLDDDKATILELHRDWWEANAGLDIPRMQKVFPTGDAYLMFNLNGHPYFNLEEKTKLWEFYSTRLEIAMPEVVIMRLDVVGDLAYLCAEGVFPSRVKADAAEADVEASDAPRLVRATEIYKRDDGQGNPTWTMWHFHCSPLPAGDSPRPAFDDTTDQRGLGFVPGVEPISVVGK